MFPFPDIPNANPALRSQFDAQVGLLAQLSQRNCDLFERLSALNLQMARQAIDMIQRGSQGTISYEMTGKLSGSAFSSTRFRTRGEFDLPATSAPEDER